MVTIVQMFQGWVSEINHNFNKEDFFLILERGGEGEVEWWIVNDP